MIFGLGIDMVELDRFQSLLDKGGDAFIKRFAHPEEIRLSPVESSPRFLEYWTARFTVRESFSKALGTGLGENFEKNFVSRQMGVTKDENGKPGLVFDGELKVKLEKLGIRKTHLSITHTKLYAASVVVLEA